MKDKLVIADFIPSGKDKFEEVRSLGISRISFKRVPDQFSDTLILENTFHQKGGPAKHLHFNQDEWFYALEGEFLIEVGERQCKMKPGDSILAPRMIPHVWAYTGNSIGRMLIVFSPAGKMVEFFREVNKTSAMPIQDPQLWLDHDMKLVGPPLKV